MAKAKNPVSRSNASTAAKKVAASKAPVATTSSTKATEPKAESTGDIAGSTSSSKTTDAGSAKMPPVGAKTSDTTKVEKPDVADVKKASTETKTAETPKVETKPVEAKPAAAKPAAAKSVETKEPPKTGVAQEASKSVEKKVLPDAKAASDTKSPFASNEAPEAETKVPPKSEPPKPAPPPSAVPEKGGSIFLPLVIGGLIAGALGFFAAEMDFLGNRSQTMEMQRSISDQQSRLSTLEQAEPVAAEVDFSGLDELTANYESLSGQLADFDARLSVVEQQPVAGGSSTADVAAYEGELAALQASVEKQRAEIEGLLNNALSVEEATANVARSARLQGALTQITAAISAGQPFDEPLAMLKQDGMENIPAALNDAGSSGVVTLNNLQSRFPDNARAALASLRAIGEDEEAPGFGGFLRRQLGARSVTPREGDDPDAVLSRAEVAVRDGRLDEALSDLDKLPQAGQDAMQEWLADARARQAVQVATQDLSLSLSAN